MRKKIFTQSLLLIAMLFSGVSSWADDVAYKTLTFSSETNGQSIGNYTATWNATIDGFTWTLENFNNNNNNWEYVKCGRKNNESVGTITTASKIDKAITKVVVTVDAVKADYVNSSKLYVADDAEFSSNLQTIDIEIDEGDNTFTVTNPTANSYYKLEFDCASASANGIVTISKIVYYTNDGGAPTPQKTEAGLAFEKDTYETNVGESFMAPSLTNPNNLDVTYESSNTDVATVDAGTGVVTIKAAGSTKITASSIETDTYKAGEASYTLTVIDTDAKGQVNNPFTVAEAIAAIDAGVNSAAIYYVKGIISQIDSYNNTYQSITYWISEDGTTESAQFQVYGGLNIDGEGFASINDLQEGDEVVVKGLIKLFNSSIYEFDRNNQLVSLNRPVHVVKTDVVLSFPKETYNATVGNDFTAPTLTIKDAGGSEVSGLTIKYSSSNTDVATVDESTGEVNILMKGETTIIAKFEGDDTYNRASTQYTLTVEGRPANTEGLIADVLNNAFTGVSGTTYTDFGNKIAASSALYAGQCAGSNDAIQLRSKNKNSGIISTSYAGKIKAIKIVWNVNTADARTLDVYASNTPYTAATDLYDEATQGTKVASFKMSDGNAIAAIEGDYDYIGFRSKSDPIYLDEVIIYREPAMEIGEAGWKAFVPAADFAIPTGVEAYVVTEVKPTYVTLAPVGDLKAESPVLLKGSANKYDLTIISGATAPTVNHLQVSDGTVQENIYVLAEKDSNVGFYKWGGESALSAGRVYLPVPTNAREFIGISFEATGINTAKAAETNGMVYNLQGQRVVKAQKGLYIVNGKKVIKN